MRARIDSRGRITIPRSIRERFYLEPGTTLELEDRSPDLLLKPVIVRKNGHWVYVDAVPADTNLDALIDDMREQRIKDIWNSGSE